MFWFVLLLENVVMLDLKVNLFGCGVWIIVKCSLIKEVMKCKVFYWGFVKDILIGFEID